MMRLLATVMVIVAAGALAVGTAPGADAGTASAAATLHGTWQKLPAAPVTQVQGSMVSAWTGREMIIHGNATTFAYRPATRTWVRLANGPGQPNLQSADVAAWTGSRMLVIGLTNASYNPVTNAWRAIARPGTSMSGAVTGWTGRQFLAWDGVCCEDFTNTGVAYSPATNTWRNIPSAPLEKRAFAKGAWTGKELVVAGGITDDPTYKVFRDAAAYNPATGKWRKLPNMPATLTDRTGALGRQRGPVPEHHQRPRAGVQPGDEPLALPAGDAAAAPGVRGGLDRPLRAGLGRGSSAVTANPSFRRTERPTTRSRASGPRCPAHRCKAARARRRCGPVTR